jgi:hypothetical protein
MNFLRMLNLDGLNAVELRAALIELCESGLLTCARGEPGSDDATYALAWLPLDNPEQFSESVRKQHAENMRKFGRTGEEVSQ